MPDQALELESSTKPEADQTCHLQPLSTFVASDSSQDWLPTRNLKMSWIYAEMCVKEGEFQLHSPTEVGLCAWKSTEYVFHTASAIFQLGNSLAVPDAGTSLFALHLILIQDQYFTVFNDVPSTWDAKLFSNKAACVKCSGGCSLDHSRLLSASGQTHCGDCGKSHYIARQ